MPDGIPHTYILMSSQIFFTGMYEGQSNENEPTFCCIEWLLSSNVTIGVNSAVIPGLVFSGSSRDSVLRVGVC